MAFLYIAIASSLIAAMTYLVSIIPDDMLQVQVGTVKTPVENITEIDYPSIGVYQLANNTFRVEVIFDVIDPEENISDKIRVNTTNTWIVFSKYDPIGEDIHIYIYANGSYINESIFTDLVPINITIVDNNGRLMIYVNGIHKATINTTKMRTIEVLDDGFGIDVRSIVYYYYGYTEEPNYIDFKIFLRVGSLLFSIMLYVKAARLMGVKL